MKNVQELIADLVIKYNYKRLPTSESDRVRLIYKSYLPKLNSSLPLLDSKQNQISGGYDRITIGDYGAFIEISEDKMNLDLLSIPSNQKFRLNKGFYGKYIWMTTDGINKIYKQIGTVSYADYKIGCYYISPYEVKQNL